MNFAGMHLVWLSAWATLVTAIFEFTHWDWLTIPWLPVAAIGTAVAFYIGFKNNSAYDRLWEARKIWGGIVNTSRMWGSNVKGFVTNQFSEVPHAETELHAVHRRLLYRHIGWLYTLRSQLLVPAHWEHINQGKRVGNLTRRRMKKIGSDTFITGIDRKQLKSFFSDEELNRLLTYKNTATQIVDLQSQDLKQLRHDNLVDDFRHMELQQLLNDLYEHQGKCERIKKFPLPRQYGSASFVFVAIFIFLLPLGMVSEFHKLGEKMVWLSIPFTIIVGWVFLMMELIGDYSENPFEGMANDIPMLSLCRTIETDLREMLGETDLPPAIEPRNSILM